MEYTARYSHNFLDCIIKKIDGYDLVLIDDGEICDLVDKDVTNFVFNDRSKKYDELLNLDNTQNSLFAGEHISIRGKVDTIRFIIRGYNANLDKLAFDATLLSLTSPYKYSISDNAIEIRLDIESDLSDILGFLNSIKYEYFGNTINESRTIFIYADADLIYTNRLKVNN